jgi:hypothetical protein
MALSNQEIILAKERWQEIAANSAALAEALANLNSRDVRRLKRHPDLVHFIGILAESAQLPDPFHPTSVPK